jgi:hypothetical protein
LIVEGSKKGFKLYVDYIRLFAELSESHPAALSAPPSCPVPLIVGLAYPRIKDVLAKQKANPQSS